MTGHEILKRVCSLLGYQNFDKSNPPVNYTAFCDMLNQIADDLKLPNVENLGQNLTLTVPQGEALIYGCAMLFSLSIRDTGCAGLYSELYNSKRMAVLSVADSRQDVIPRPFKGGM